MISFIIPVFNNLNITLTCLNDLSYLPREECEIIVIDDGSTDALLKEELKKRNDIKLITNEKNKGFGKACSAGYHRAKGDIITILNNDIRVRKERDIWHNYIIDELKNEPDSLIGPTGGYVNPITGDFQYETQNSKSKINYISGWCISAKRKIWDFLSYGDYIFDPDFTHYFEDTSLGFKAINNDIKLKIIDVPLVHFGKLSSKHLNIPVQYQKSKEIFIKKWCVK